MKATSSVISVSEAIARLRGDDVVALPTETVYGLAAWVQSPEAIEKVFQLKSRPFFDPLIVHVADLAMAQSITAAWPEVIERLCRSLWPGPLTVVLDKKTTVSDVITSGSKTVAVRCPNHPLTLEVIRAVGPVAAPSANRFGKTSPTEAQHVEQEFGNAVGVLDGGPCLGGLESTIVGFSEGQLEILRPGLITKKQLRTLLKDLDVAVVGKATPQMPGSLEHHYQPETPLILVENPVHLDVRPTLQAWAKGRGFENAIFRELILDPQPELAARRLYAQMRSAEKSDFLYVVRTKKNSNEDWEGIWDRLQRASSFKVFCE
jgi:L-threonylcarbamoyladenylate synthase